MIRNCPYCNRWYLDIKQDSPLIAAYKTLLLQPNAPIDVIRSMYRFLAKTHHPDKGGNPEAMKNINIAYGLIETAESCREAARNARAVRARRRSIRRAVSRGRRRETGGQT